MMLAKTRIASVGPTTPAGGGVGVTVVPALPVADGAGVLVIDTIMISVGVGVLVGVPPAGGVPVGVTDGDAAGVDVGVAVGVSVGLGVTLIAFVGVGVDVGVMLGTQVCRAVAGAPCEQAFTGVTVQLYSCPDRGVNATLNEVVFPDLTTCPVVVSRIS